VDGENRVVWQESVNEKMPNSAKMTLNKEDHTYGNLIRM
jgi:DNA-directed RNA polymerase subunit L